MGLSIQQIKEIKSYQQKKFRDIEGLFIAETPKVIETFLNSPMALISVYGLSDYICCLSQKYPLLSSSFFTLSPKELDRITGLTSAQQAVGIWQRPQFSLDNNDDDAFIGLSLVLDQLQDPGNLGTIIRIADWFGIDRIICSNDSADAFQPKCIQSSMGAVANIPIYYTDLNKLSGSAPKDFPFYGAFLDGENIFTSSLNTENAWYIIGNEAHGINPEIESFINKKIHIPSFSPKTCPNRTHGTESLNAAMATGIICAQIRKDLFPSVISPL